MEDVAKPTPTEQAPSRAPVSFLLPSYKTPALAADLLYAAAGTKAYGACQFVLLLDVSDPSLLLYKATVDALRSGGFPAGYFVFDGTPYAGQVNRVAPIVDSDCVCVIDGSHLPIVSDGPFDEAVRKWLSSSIQRMRVGTFTEDGSYPLVTRALIDRLGYMFHPLARGRIEAENWLLLLGESLDILSPVPGGAVAESKTDSVEIVGETDPDHGKWVDETLLQILDEESERLSQHLIG